MKRTVRILALTLALVMCLTLLTGCAGLSGSYESSTIVGSKVTYTFKGNKVSVVVTALGTDLAPVEGTFTLGKGGTELTITILSGEEGDQYSGTHSLEKGRDYIKIDGVTYTLVK